MSNKTQDASIKNQDAPTQKPFFTEVFYTSQGATLIALSLLLQDTFDYQCTIGANVDHFTVIDTPKVRKILSALISDFDQYLEFQTNTHWIPEEDEIPLNAMLMEYYEYFKAKGGLLIWNKNNRIGFETPPGSFYRILTNEDIAQMESETMDNGKEASNV